MERKQIIENVVPQLIGPYQIVRRQGSLKVIRTGGASLSATRKLAIGLVCVLLALVLHLLMPDSAIAFAPGVVGLLVVLLSVFYVGPERAEKGLFLRPASLEIRTSDMDRGYRVDAGVELIADGQSLRGAVVQTVCLQNQLVALWAAVGFGALALWSFAFVEVDRRLQRKECDAFLENFSATHR